MKDVTRGDRGIGCPSKTTIDRLGSSEIFSASARCLFDQIRAVVGVVYTEQITSCDRIEGEGIFDAVSFAQLAIVISFLMPSFAQLTIVTWMRFSEVISFTLMIPLLPFFVQHLLDTDDADPRISYYSGLALGIQQLCEAASSFLFGWLSDTHGRRPVILLGIGVTVVSSFVMAFTTSLPMLFAARAGRGLGNGNLGVTKTYLAEITDGTSRARVFDLFVTVSGIGFAIGPCLAALANPADWAPAIAPAGSLLERYPFALPFCLVGGVSAVTLALSVCYLGESHPQLRQSEHRRGLPGSAASVQAEAACSGTRCAPLLEDDSAAAPSLTSEHEAAGAAGHDGAEGSAARAGAADDPQPAMATLPARHVHDADAAPPSRHYRRAACVAVSLYVTIAAHEIIYIQIFALWAKLPPSASGLGWSLGRIGIAQSACGAGMVFAVAASAALRRYLSPINATRVAILLPTASVAATPFMSSFAAIIALQALAWIGYAPIFSASILFINNSAPSEVLGRINGVAQAAAGVTRFVGPLLGGALIGRLSHRPPPYDSRMAFLGDAVFGGLYLALTCLLPRSIIRPFGKPPATS